MKVTLAELLGRISAKEGAAIELELKMAEWQAEREEELKRSQPTATAGPAPEVTVIRKRASRGA